MEKAAKTLKENKVFQHLCTYLPNLILFVGTEMFGWNRVDQLFNAELRRRTAGMKEDEFITVQATVYDIIVEAMKENRRAIGLLDFLNITFGELLIKLSPAEKRMVRSNISSMLSSMDKNYLNYAGEIATLNALMKTGFYQLVAVEWKLPNGKKIDFRLHKKDEKIDYLVEVMNIHIDGDKIEANPEAIQKFLNKRAANKFLDKKSALTEEISFYVIPVLWGSASEITVYKEFYQTHRPIIDSTLEPFVYCMETDHIAIYRHSFRPVSTFPDIN